METLASLYTTSPDVRSDVLQELNNATIPAEDKGRVIVSNNVLTFTYLDHTKDNGSYQCAARNAYATRYSTAELRVLRQSCAASICF